MPLRDQTLASDPASDTHAGWHIKVTQPDRPGEELLSILIDAELDLSTAADRAVVGRMCAALRAALDTSANSWSGGAR